MAARSGIAMKCLVSFGSYASNTDGVKPQLAFYKTSTETQQILMLIIILGAIIGSVELS